MNIVVGTRGSTLALSQTLLLVDELKKLHKNLIFEVKIIKTKGDLNQTTLLHKMNDKGIFVKEIEEQLIEGGIDLAVHSMKDMPSEMDERLDFPVVSKREDPRDVLVLRSGLKEEELASCEALRIGTGSKRRAFQLSRLYPRAQALPIRGNIDTRIRKITQEDLDGVILAAAGLLRVGREAEIGKYFSQEEMLPAPCQGMLALQTRREDSFMREILQGIADEEATIQYRAERAFLSQTGGGCHLPIGAYCHVRKEGIELLGLLGTEDGRILLRDRTEGRAEEAEKLGRELACRLKNKLEGRDE